MMAAKRGAWLLLVAGLAIGVGGVTLEVKLRPRALPRTDAPLIAKAQAATSMTPAQLGLLIGKVAPKLDLELRARLVDAVLAESTRNGYDPVFLLALVGVESRWRVRAESERGAKGLLQLEPSTYAWISAREPDVGGEDLELGSDPIVDLRLAIRYFGWLEGKFKSRDAALMAYNAGPRKTRQKLRSGEVPDSMHAYPQRVRAEYQRLLTLQSQQADLSGALARE